LRRYRPPVRMTGSQARAAFQGARVARLATAGADGLPHLVPLVFVVDDDTVYWAVDHKPKSGARLRRLANIADNPSVCLLADHYDDDWSRLWWARADGVARVLTQPDAAPALELLMHRYTQYRTEPPPGPVVAVAVTRWSGWSGEG
jgi:PPOX class probable F420-dependent enzyme